MHEEIGIKVNISDLVLVDTFILKMKLDNNTFLNRFTFLYAVMKNVDISNLKIQVDEVSIAMFIGKSEYLNLLSSNKVVEGIKCCDKLMDYII